MLTSSDEIIIFASGINVLINVILIKRHDRRSSTKKEHQIYSRKFWGAYLLFVPFFLTNSIIKEIENKKKKEQTGVE